MVASGPTQRVPLSPSFGSCFHPRRESGHTWNTIINWKHLQHDTILTIAIALSSSLSLGGVGWDGNLSLLNAQPGNTKMNFYFYFSVFCHFFQQNTSQTVFYPKKERATIVFLKHERSSIFLTITFFLAGKFLSPLGLEPRTSHKPSPSLYHLSQSSRTSFSQ